jgi:ComF family protein
VGQISVRPRILQPRFWLEAALDLLFPPQCVGCSSPGSVWCPSCGTRLQILRRPMCTLCGRPIAKGARICRDCAASPPRLLSRSFAWYRPPLDAAVLHLKYRPDRRLASLMGGWLAEIYRTAGWYTDLITAVPLSSNRRRQRGYNQASLLGAALGRRTGLPLRDGVLGRRRETGTQVGLGPEERRENVSGAFEARQAAVQNRAVIVVDDLYTTGATLGACAISLFEAGASRVYGLTAARAGHIDPGANRHGGQYHNESPDQRPPIRAHGSDA